MKRTISALLAVVVICSVFVTSASTVGAISQLSSPPYPNVEYQYSSEVQVGTIRYIAQNTASEYFNWNYWPSNSFGGYSGGPQIECGTACISMALSYVGVNRTPKALLEATNGYTSAMWGQQDSATSRSISISKSGIAAAMDDYINGNGKFSPVLIYIQPFSATSSQHWVLLAGKTGENQYIALNPWHSAGTNGTLYVQINGSTATYNGTTNPITSVNQWYNPNASIVCDHSYFGTVTESATCGKDGLKTYTCSKCGDSYTETIPATGAHSYGVWETVTEAGCVTEGLERQVCICGAEQTRTISVLGHDCASYYIPATCVEPAFVHYECRRCTLIYNEYGGEWSESKPVGIPDDQLETKTQYRYSDYTVHQTYAPELVSGDLISAEWMEQSTCDVQYVKDWPGGFETSHTLYRTYNNDAASNSETDTVKVTVNSEKITGYIYWHWCRGTYTDGPINRKTSTVQAGEFNTFHAFFSTTNPATMTNAGDGSVTYPNADCCRDSHWYYNVPIYTQSYSTYEKLFTFGVWEEWSNWGDMIITATDTRKVESRTLYRYVGEELAECSWDDGAITVQPTCTSTGVRTYTCAVCGTTKTESISATGHNYQNGYCIQCSAEDPNYNFVAAEIAVGTVSGEKDETVTVPVSISNNPGIAGFTFVFDYDAAALTLTGISKGQVLQDGSFTPNVSGKTLNWFNAVNVTENGVLFNLTFKITASEGNFNVTVALKDGKSTNFVNENAKAQRVVFEAGTVQIVKEHKWDAGVVSTAPTCTEDGIKTFTCMNCGDIRTEPVLATGQHSWSAWKTILEPTCEEEGTVVRQCTSCMEQELDFVSPKGHALEEVPGYAATCTKPGMTASIECKNCGEVAVSGKEIPKIDHSFNQGVCSVCGAIDQRCGDNITWSIDDGILTLTGTGEMYDFGQGATPWNAYLNDIEKVVIGNGITTIGKNAFRDCQSLLDVVIPNSVSSINTCAFCNCSGIEKVAIPDGVSTIGSGVFRECSNLQSVSIPDSVVSLGGAVFANCIKLDNVTIPDGVTTIDNSLFDGCTALKNVRLSENTEWIGAFVFYKCISLERLTIPSAVSYLDGFAFMQCPNLKEIRFKGNAKWSAIGMLPKNATVYYPAENDTWTVDEMKKNGDRFAWVAEEGIAIYNNFGEQYVCTYFDDALEEYHYDSQYLKIRANMIVEMSLNQDLCIDLNGYNLFGTITTNGYKIYCMDSTTDGYTCDRIGSFNCVNENGNVVIPVSHFRSDITGSAKRYMAIEGENGYSFHRFYLAITHQTLRPTSSGIGYKAVFYGDEMVTNNLQGIGFILQLGENDPKQVTKTSVVSGKTITLRIDNYDVEGYGETELYGFAVLILKDGTVIESTKCTTTLRSLLEALNANYAALNADQLAAVAEFIKKYAIIDTWKVDNLI